MWETVCVEVCVGSHLVGGRGKRWTDSVNDYLEKKRFECWASKEDGL